MGKESSHPGAKSHPLTLRDALTGLDDRKQSAPQLTPTKVQRWRETKPGGAHSLRFSTLRLAWDKTPPTIVKTPGSGGHFHPTEPRLLDVGELQRIASFPDAFRFVSDWMMAVNRIGNSVPPLFMRAIARHLREHIL
jgi:DNA (cytosine-5)-methyltransferase 1